MASLPKIEIELNAALVAEINKLRECLTKIEFYAATGCLQDSFDEIKRLAREALANAQDQP
jgi:hypothetical protein